MKIRFAVVAAVTAIAAAPPVQAQGFQVGSATTINISGLLAIGLKSSEASQGNAATARAGTSSDLRLDDNTSRLIISGSSKITDGWNVVFRIESRFQPDVRPSQPLSPGNTVSTGAYAGWAEGDSWGGVQGPWGTLFAGKTSVCWVDTIDTSYLGTPMGTGESYRIWDANMLGTFIMLSQFTQLTKNAAGNYVGGASVYEAGNTRSQNMIRFNSIKFKGFDFSLAYSKNDGFTENQWVAPAANGLIAGYARPYQDGGTTYASARYNNGGFAASASVYNKVLQGGITAAGYLGPQDYHTFRLGVAYKTSYGLKAGVVYDSSKQDYGIVGTNKDAERKVFLVPISYSKGDHGFYFTYAKAGDTSGYADTGATLLTLVYDYALTKRAFAGISFATLSNAKNASYRPFLTGTTLGPSPNAPNVASVGEGFRQISLNLQYWF